METINNNNTNISMLNKDNKLAAPSAPFMQAGGPAPSSIPKAPISKNWKDMHKTTIHGKGLRIRDWGRVSEEGFSGFDRAFYYRSRLPFERNVVLEELRAKHQPLNSQPEPTSAGSRSIPSDLSGTFYPSAGAPYTGAPMTTGSMMTGPMMTESMMTAPMTTGSMMTRSMMTGPMMTAPMTTGSMMTGPIMTTSILSAPILSTTTFSSAPTHVLATTVPVPMLNAPINDGRRYQKLYKKNSGSNINNVKRRGTRTDHLVQPQQSMMPMTTGVMPMTTGVMPMTTGVMPMTTGVMPMMTGPMMTAPILSTPTFSAAPTPMLATTVPVPMINPPINDGRRYQKLYKKNSGSNINNVKRRGTRTDHLVQPQQSMMPMTTGMMPMMQSPSYIQQPISYATQPVAITSSMMPMTTRAMPMTTGAMPMTTAMPVAGTVPQGMMHRRAQQATKGHPQPVFSNVVQTGVPMM